MTGEEAFSMTDIWNEFRTKELSGADLYWDDWTSARPEELEDYYWKDYELVKYIEKSGKKGISAYALYKI